MRVCVIGAGAAGITTAKHLREKGLDVEILEKRDGIGGLWYFNKQATGVASNTIATSSKSYLQFSDLAFAKDVPHFPHHTDYIKYLKNYAEKHNIFPLIKYSHEVTDLRKNGQEWQISVRNGDNTYTTTSDAVVISSGLHHIPLIPDIPGKENYTGLETHSGLLKTGETLRGKRVVVMGVGESGADFTHYLTDFASEVYLSLRRGVVITPRWSYPSMPADFDGTRSKVWLPREFIHDFNHGCFPGLPMRQYSAFRTFYTLLGLPVWLATLPFSSQAVDFLKSLFDWRMWVALFKRQQRYGPPSGVELSKACEDLCKEGPKSEAEAEEKYWRLMGIFDWYSGAIHNAQPFTKSSDFVKDIVQGRVKVVPGINRYNGGLEVEFDDGSKREVDAVVMCTGYQAVLPFLQNKEIENKELYKFVFVPDEPTLAFVGFARPHLGALPPLCEMQARWIAKVFTGEVSLPDPEQMKQIMKSDDDFNTKLKSGYAKGKSLTGKVDYQLYLDQIAGYVGCRPNVWQLLWKPKMLYAVLFGPFVSFQYRLNGDGANIQAAEEAAALLPDLPIDGIIRNIILLLFVKPCFSLLAMLGWRRFRPVL